MITRAVAASQLALRAGEDHIAFTKSNQLALVAVMAQEGSPARCNPFDTTWRLPGSVNLPGNPDGVQEYPSMSDGYNAVWATLNEADPGFGYEPIREALKQGGCGCAVVEAWARSEWGTWRGNPAGASAFLQHVQANWLLYSNVVVIGS